MFVNLPEQYDMLLNSTHKFMTSNGRVANEVRVLSDAEEAALLLKRTPGGLDGIPSGARAHVDEIHDEQCI